MSEDLEAVDAAELRAREHDAVGRADPLEHESLTPEDRATDVEVGLGARRKWRRLHNGMLECPLCGVPVRDDWRPRGQHVSHHKDLERMRAAVGLPPAGAEQLTYDYAAMHERMRHHAVGWCAAALVLVLVLAVVLAVVSM